MSQAAPPGTLFGTSIQDDIEIVAYDAAWPAAFATHRAALWEALGSAAVRIDHVGSTAVPGLAAKPTIDIQVSVAAIDEEQAYRPALEGTGLVLRYREPGWLFFRPPAPPRTHHVHVVQAGSAQERERLLFVAYLRHAGDRRDGYAALKRDLARRYRSDRLRYTGEKTEFIRATLAAAERWASVTGWRVDGVPQE